MAKTGRRRTEHDPEKEKRTCLRKKTYPTRKIAKRAARRLHSHTGKLYRTYVCPNCDLYHLTTKPASHREFLRKLIKKKP